jgi:hypothetical protein
MSVSSCENFSPVKKTFLGSSRLRSGTSEALRNFKVSTQDIIDAGPSSSLIYNNLHNLPGFLTEVLTTVRKFV